MSIVKKLKSQYDGEVKEFELTKEENVVINKKNYSHTCWTQKEGVMENGSPEVLEFICKTDDKIDYKTLNTDCLNKIV